MKKVLVLMAAVMLVMGFSMTASAVVIGDASVTGNYYRYGYFTSSDGFLGGNDVDAYGDTIYVNRNGSILDAYTVSLADTDGDGFYEPDQHPSNPSATGPMEVRTLTHVRSYSVPALGSPSIGEIYAAKDGVYFLSQGNTGIDYYDFGTGVTSTVVSSSKNLSHLGYDDVNNTWYASNEQARRVYSWDGTSWVTEFDYPVLAGGHMDGLEVVTDPNTGIPYVYVSDMTSDFLGQYYYDGSNWQKGNIFAYTGTGAVVEGMGFGALGHFWATGWGQLYEIGGGDLGGYTGTVPEPATMLLLGFGLIGMFGLKKKNPSCS